MIEVTKSIGRIVVTGHADYAPRGNDIFCAGVSTLIHTLVDSVETLTEDEIEYEVSPGRADIDISNLRERSKLLVDSFFIGIKIFADEHPDYVRIIMSENDDKLSTTQATNGAVKKGKA